MFSAHTLAGPPTALPATAVPPPQHPEQAPDHRAVARATCCLPADCPSFHLSPQHSAQSVLSCLPAVPRPLLSTCPGVPWPGGCPCLGMHQGTGTDGTRGRGTVVTCTLWGRGQGLWQAGGPRVGVPSVSPQQLKGLRLGLSRGGDWDWAAPAAGSREAWARGHV